MDYYPHVYLKFWLKENYANFVNIKCSLYAKLHLVKLNAFILLVAILYLFSCYFKLSVS